MHNLSMMQTNQSMIKTNTDPKKGIVCATKDIVASSDRWVRGKIAAVIDDLEITWFVEPNHSRAPEGNLFWYVVTNDRES